MGPERSRVRVARRKTLSDRIRAEGGNQLLLDAGDVFQGTLYFNKYMGQADLYFYNQLKYDAMTIGNHEFYRGRQPLADFINGATFPVLSANITADASSPLPLGLLGLMAAGAISGGLALRRTRR